MEELFTETFNRFAAEYPYRKLKMESSPWGTIVWADGKEQFNISGYNLLYNLSRLCNLLEDELR